MKKKRKEEEEREEGKARKLSKLKKRQNSIKRTSMVVVNARCVTSDSSKYI